MNAVSNVVPLNAAVPTLPESVDLEQAVLGACICANDQIDQIFGACQAADFYHAPHPLIAGTIAALHAEDVAVSPLSLASRLGGHPAIRELGGHVYFTSLAAAAPAGGYTALAAELAELARRRGAVIACIDAQAAIGCGNGPLLDCLRPVLDAADRAVTARDKRRGGGSTADAIRDAVGDAYERTRGKSTAVVPTGLECLDNALGGLQAGDLCIYAGRPGMGKSSLLQMTALNAAMRGRPVLFLSLEMTREQLLHRIGTDIDYGLNHVSPLSYSWFRAGKATEAQVSRLAEALYSVPDHLEIRDTANLTIHEIAALAKAFAARHRSLGLVVIDYLQKVAASDRYRGNKVQEVTEISGHAKALAKTLGWPVMAGAQLSRAVEARMEQRPTLADLRESGAIEQDADQVIGLYRPGYYIEAKKPSSVHDAKYADWAEEYRAVKNRLDLGILKNRHGATESLSVWCELRASAIRNEAPR